MSSSHDFDEFYVATRRRLVLQTFALTGDLGAGRNAVRDAFVAARHHWNKVGRLTDPEDWVRPRAWSIAQRRHVGHIWHKEKGLKPQQAAVLDALHQLPERQRKALLLNHLAALSLPHIARELGETPEGAGHHLQQATAAFALAMDCDSTAIRTLLESLEPAAASVALPRAPSIRRSGARRRRWHLIGGTVAAVVLTLAAGSFVVNDAQVLETLAIAKDKPVTRKMLLTASDVSAISPTQLWRDIGTSDNTLGTGINTVCQTSRFADPAGEGTLVRRFIAVGQPSRSVLQTVEISASRNAAAQAYKTTLGWFAGCTQARLQLLNAYRVTGLGDEAQLLRLRVPDQAQRTYVVGIARSGSLTTSTVVETTGGRSVQLNLVVNALMTSVRHLCDADKAGACPTTATAVPVLPPPSGETPGMLAVADLPPIGTINMPWFGTKPVISPSNLSATTCDKADFIKGGAPRALTRTFLIPQARLPKRFGLVETSGGFRDAATAQKFLMGVTAKMGGCEKADLASTIDSSLIVLKGWRGSQYALWRVDNEINAKEEKVSFWMGVARVGNHVAQVNFTPTPGNDLDEESFRSLLTRARDRLFELPPQ